MNDIFKSRAYERLISYHPSPTKFSLGRSDGCWNRSSSRLRCPDNQMAGSYQSKELDFQDEYKHSNSTILTQSEFKIKRRNELETDAHQDNSRKYEELLRFKRMKMDMYKSLGILKFKHERRKEEMHKRTYSCSLPRSTLKSPEHFVCSKLSHKKVTEAEVLMKHSAPSLEKVKYVSENCKKIKEKKSLSSSVSLKSDGSDEHVRMLENELRRINNQSYFSEKRVENAKNKSKCHTKQGIKGKQLPEEIFEVCDNEENLEMCHNGNVAMPSDGNISPDTLILCIDEEEVADILSDCV